MSEKRITIRVTKSYNGTLVRNNVPVGVIIEGWGDDQGHFFASVANNYMKVNWWVPLEDVAIYTETPPPEPPPSDFTPIAEFNALEADGNWYRYILSGKVE